MLAFSAARPRARSASLDRRRLGPQEASRAAEKEEDVLTYRVGYFIGSLSSESINRTLSEALIEELRRLDPDEIYGEVLTKGLQKVGA